MGKRIAEGVSVPGGGGAPEIAIGEIDGPVGQAMTNLMGQSAGFSRFFCLVDGGKQVKPVTLMVPKVHLEKMIDVQIFGGPVQAGIADGVLDAVEAVQRPVALVVLQSLDERRTLTGDRREHLPEVGALDVETHAPRGERTQ